MQWWQDKKNGMKAPRAKNKSKMGKVRNHVKLVEKNYRRVTRAKCRKRTLAERAAREMENSEKRKDKCLNPKTRAFSMDDLERDGSDGHEAIRRKKTKREKTKNTRFQIEEQTN